MEHTSGQQVIQHNAHEECWVAPFSHLCVRCTNQLLCVIHHGTPAARLDPQTGHRMRDALQAPWLEDCEMLMVMLA